MNHAVASRITGYILSLIVTCLAYVIIVQPEIFDFTNKIAVFTIFGLALLQSLVQLIFFIDVWHERGTFWNLGVFISTVSIIFIVIFFSILIINHLNCNMR